MLQFIFGKPATGKTFTVLEKIKDLTLLGQECVLIVPEQFTFESERAVLKKLGDKASLSVNVLSFTRLCEIVSQEIGGLAGITLNECDKIILMKRTLASVKDKLQLWSSYTNSLNFAKSMLDTIGEFKINSITPEEIKNAAEFCESAKLTLKLEDISLIYETYNILTGEKFIDPADSLTKLYNNLENYKFFSNKTVFIDSFKGFTGQQFRIIDRIFSQAEDVYVSLTNNPSNNREYNLFTNIRSAVEKITKIAEKTGKKISSPIVLTDSHFGNSDILNLEKLISGEDINITEKSENITVCNAATIFDEANFVAQTIRRLVRQNGYRYRDFVIIARDAGAYKESVLSACKQNNIALFFDNRIPLSAFPLSRVAESAIASLDFERESILKFHKTGLGTLNTEEISILENYTYLWNLSGKEWLNDFTADPRGFVTDDLDEKAIKDLENINNIRKKAVEPIIKFKNEFHASAEKMARSIINLFEFCNCSDKLIELCSNLTLAQENFNENVLKQSYEVYMRLLDSLVKCFGDMSITKNEFVDALSLAVSLSDVGVIPQMLDEVAFGSADRIRPSRPKIAFIMGANQGIFPKMTSNAGLFNIAERKNLIEQGLEIADNSVYSSIDEEYLVYCNLCCPSEKHFVSYSVQTISGESLEPSAFVLSIKENLNCKTVSFPTDDFNEDNSPETESTAFSEFCKRISNDKNNAYSIKKAINNPNKFDNIELFHSETPQSISPEIAKKLFGEKIKMSASKFDVFNRCRFSFFCKYGLSAKKLQPADFDVMQRGTIVHYVLERFVSENKDSLIELDKPMTDILTDKYIAEYLDSINGFRQLENSRTQFLISRISRSLKDVVNHIREELSQSEFKPVACELKIGSGSENGELLFDYNGGKISLNGSIDRVDSYNGYIRIIDYKTGSKNFKLPDILFGLNLQMLIYLYAVTRGNGLDDEKAAAILYQPSKRDLNDSGMAMNGLLQSDSNLVFAMDKNGAGDYIPKISLNKDGTISKRSTSFIDPDGFAAIFDYIEILMKKTGNSISSGDIAISPIDGRESPACKYCDYKNICGIEDREIKRVPDLKNSEVIEKIKEAEINGI